MNDWIRATIGIEALTIIILVFYWVVGRKK